MKIVYSAGNRVGANSQLIRFLKAVNGQHEIRIAAYLKSSETIAHIDWTLDALQYDKAPTSDTTILYLFDSAKVPFVNIKNVTIFLDEVERFEPDLFIIDGEPIAANIAAKLKVPAWYCSPLHLLDGIEWEKGQLKYLSKLKQLRQQLDYFPENVDEILIYSPFGDIKNSPYLKQGYKWIRPYHYKADNSPVTTPGIAIINDHNRISELSKILNSTSFDLQLFSPFNEKYSNLESYSIYNTTRYNASLAFKKWLFTTGETSFVSDAFYNLISICVSPSLDDHETLLNAILCREYDIGTDVGQIELGGKFAIDEIENAYKFRRRYDYLNNQEIEFLHNKVEECNI
jgi:hypothetical protein